MTGVGLAADWGRLEGADYILDMETSLPNRKRLWDKDMYSVGHGKFDASYISFLDDLHNLWEAKFVLEEDDDKEEDPNYMAFLGNLKVHGNAYMCDVSSENGVSSPIIYEEESNSADKIKRRTARMCIGTPVGEKRKFMHDDDMKFVRKDSVAKNDSGGELKRRSVVLVGDQKSHVKNLDSRSDHPDAIKGRKRATTSRMDGCVRENRSLGVDGDQKSGLKSFWKKRPVVDETYGIFMDHLHVKGKHVFCEYRDHNQIYYESTNHKKTDVEVVDVELEPLEAETRNLTSIMKPPTPTPGSPKTSYTAHVTTTKKPTLNKIYNDEEVAYWRELHHHLRKPYDQEEYDGLLKLLSARKPVWIHRESRSGGSDRLGHMGKSYLDLYPDLNCEIEKVKFDRHKVLNLLRMCKIYVQKIPLLQSGHTRPWMDEFSKTILPGSSDGY